MFGRKNAKPWNPAYGVAYRYRDGREVPCGPGYHPHASTRFRNLADGMAGPDGRGRELPELYSAREECCGCTACAAACTRGAVSMEVDEEGFLYPVVDAAKCVRCGGCLSACGFKGRMVEQEEAQWFLAATEGR